MTGLTGGEPGSSEGAETEDYEDDQGDDDMDADGEQGSNVVGAETGGYQGDVTHTESGQGSNVVGSETDGYQGDVTDAESEQGSSGVGSAVGAEDESSAVAYGPDSDDEFSTSGETMMNHSSQNLLGNEVEYGEREHGPGGVGLAGGAEDESLDATYVPDIVDGFSTDHGDSVSGFFSISVTPASESTVEGPIMSETKKPGDFVGAAPDGEPSRLHADVVFDSYESDGSDDLKRKRTGGSRTKAKRARTDGSDRKRKMAAAGSRAKAKRDRTDDIRFSPEVRLAQQEDALRAYGLRNTTVRNTRRERLKREAEREEITRGKRPKQG